LKQAVSPLFQNFLSSNSVDVIKKEGQPPSPITPDELVFLIEKFIEGATEDLSESEIQEIEALSLIYHNLQQEEKDNQKKNSASTGFFGRLLGTNNIKKIQREEMYEFNEILVNVLQSDPADDNVIDLVSTLINV